MTQSTMTKPATSSTYNPYSDMDADKKKSDAATADSVSAEPVYKLVIDENVVEKISSMAAQKIDGIIDMKGNVLSRIQEGLGGADKTKGVDADIVDDTNAKINLDVIMEYGKSAPEIRPVRAPHPVLQARRASRAAGFLTSGAGLLACPQISS